jgi:hypothetical protein
MPSIRNPPPQISSYLYQPVQRMTHNIPSSIMQPMQVYTLYNVATSNGSPYEYGNASTTNDTQL